MALDYIDPEVRKIATQTVDAVLAALRNLYIKGEGEKNAFSFEEIVAEVQSHRPFLDKNDVLPALILATELNFFSGWSGPSTREDELRISNVSVTETILDFRSSEEQWKKIFAARATAEKQWAERAAADIVSTRISPDTPNFSFVADQKLRHIIERDYAELQEAKQASAVKTRLILSGGLIEAFLLDTLERVGEAAVKARTAEKDNKGKVRSLDNWSLSSLIDVAAELSLISDGAVKLSDMVRDFRNLVHAGKESRGDYVIGEHEAEAAEAGLNAVIRDLRARSGKSN